MVKPKIVGGYKLSDNEADAPVPPPKPTKAPVPVAPAPPFRMPPPRAQNSTATRPNPPPSHPAPSHPAPPHLAPPGSIPSRPQTAASALRPSQSAILTPCCTPNASKSNWAALDDEIATSGNDADSLLPVEPTCSKGKERIVVNEAESLQAARSGRLAHKHDMHQLQRRVNEHEATISTQKKEITNLQNKVQTLKTGLDELTQTFNNYCETQAMRWTQADLAAQAAAAAPPPPVAPAPVNAPGAPAAVEPVTTPNLSFDPTQDTKSYVPVSNAKTLFNIVFTFKHRSAADKPTIPLLNKIQVSGIIVIWNWLTKTVSSVVTLQFVLGFA
ncbi:hypothetical protein FRC07_000906 [Ceratobasidium sp. 392]|nr:hypothetical protein FRC07_000906 [Ceratobasidium sp. 392]